MGIFVGGYSYHIGLGKLLKPGPGLFPFVLSLAVLILSVYKLVKEFPLVKRPDQKEEQSPSGNTGRIVILAAILFAYTLVLERLGFLPSTFLAMVALLRVAGYTQWIRIIVYAIVICVITYICFMYLGTNFPEGIIDLDLQ